MFSNFRISAVAVMLAASIASVSAIADSSGQPTVAVAESSVTVNTMLLIDARRALANEKDLLGIDGRKLRASNSEPSMKIDEDNKPAAPKPAPMPTVTFELLGIFGLGDELMADVAIDGRRVRYKRGYSYPVGMGKDFPYKLLSIAVPCVTMTDMANKNFSVCLNKSGI